MGEEFVSFQCHHCHHCCPDVVCLLTPFDVRRIVRMTGRDPFDFIDFLTPDEIEDEADDEPTWLEVNDERYVMALKREEQTGCTFLDNETRFCSIFEALSSLFRL